jgi:hypothetical protein
MRFDLFTAIVAGAALTQVGASPLRVVVVTSHQELAAAPNFRFGHPLADSHVAKLSLPGTTHTQHMKSQTGRRPCGQRIRQKAIDISNTFRHALGLPLIESGHPKPGDHIHGGMVHIMPFVGASPTMIFKPAEDRHAAVNNGHLYHPHPHKFHKWGRSFSMRIHNALMALGPWEGRAVAFVLGCGIGVLMRMFWVLTVVVYRSTCGGRDDEYTQVAVIEEYIDAEDIIVPPPTYTVADEKDQVKIKDTKDGVEN